MKIAKILGSAFAFSLVAMVSPEASADYVCRTSLIPGNTNLGSQGYVYATFYASPNCGGALIGARYFCTGGAVNSNCTLVTNYTYERASLLELYAGLRNAADVDQLVASPPSACHGGGAAICGGIVYFDAN